jgi:hypothetical protein
MQKMESGERSKGCIVQMKGIEMLFGHFYSLMDTFFVFKLMLRFRLRFKIGLRLRFGSLF